MSIPEATFSNPFSTWGMFLSKELAQLLPWPNQVPMIAGCHPYANSTLALELY